MNIQKEANYETLDSEEQRSLDDQLNEMIRNKYTDINYNGMNENKMKPVFIDTYISAGYWIFFSRWYEFSYDLSLKLTFSNKNYIFSEK